MSESIYIKELFAESGCLTLHGMRAHLNSSLSEAEDDRVISHLLECDLCSESLGGLEMTPSDAAVLAAVSDITERVREKTNTTAATGSQATLYPWHAAVAAAAVVLIFFSFYFWQMNSDPQSVDTFAQAQVQETEQEKAEKDLKSAKAKTERSDNFKQPKKESFAEDIPAENDANVVGNNDLAIVEEMVEEPEPMADAEVFAPAPLEEIEEEVAMEDAEIVDLSDDDFGDAGFDDADSEYRAEMDEVTGKNMEGLNRDLLNNRAALEDQKKSQVVKGTTKDIVAADKALPHSNSGYNYFSKKEEAKAKKKLLKAPKVAEESKEQNKNDGFTSSENLKLATDSVSSSPTFANDIAVDYEMEEIASPVPAVNTKTNTKSLADRKSVKSAGQKTRTAIENSKAKSSAEKAVSQSTGLTSSSYASNGMVYFQAGDYRSAHDAFEAALDLNPNNHEARLYIARCFLELKAAEKALNELDYLLSVPNMPYQEEAEWYQTQALIAVEKETKAKENLERIIRKDGFYRSKAEKALKRMR